MWAAHDGCILLACYYSYFKCSFSYIIVLRVAHGPFAFSVHTYDPSQQFSPAVLLFVSLTFDVWVRSRPHHFSVCCSRCESSSCVTAGSNNSWVFSTAVCSPLNVPPAFFSCRLPEEVRRGLWLVSSGYF